MRRETLVAVLAASAAIAGSRTARADGPQAPDPASVPAAAASLGLKSDVVSGCVHGAPLVKILVRLLPSYTTKGCRAEVTPASVCVAPGGVVRFRVDNGCEGRSPIEIGQPRRKNLDGPPAKAHDKSDPLPEDQKVFATCALKVPERASGDSFVFFCDVGWGVSEGFYKYDVFGDRIDRLDPDVEVRGGRNP